MIVLTTIYVVLCSIYPDDLIEIISINEALSGLGAAAGPAVGSALYSAMGYEYLMYTFGGLNFFGTLLIMLMLPNSLNKLEEASEECDNPIRLKDVFCNRHSFFGLLVCFCTLLNATFYQGFLSKTLRDMGFSDSQTGYVFTANCIFYLFTCYAVNYISISRKLNFAIGMVTYALVMIPYGPSKTLHIP